LQHKWLDFQGFSAKSFVAMLMQQIRKAMGELSVSADYCNVHNSFVANFLAFDKPFLHREFLQMYASFAQVS